MTYGMMMLASFMWLVLGLVATVKRDRVHGLVLIATSNVWTVGALIVKAIGEAAGG